MTGPKNEKGETTWGGLAEEVRYWGNWVLEKVKAEIGDLYPLIPDPEAKEEEIDPDSQHVMEFAKNPQGKLKVKKGYLIPVAYLWTRTVKCKNPRCDISVPLVKQTWLCKKKGRYVAMKMVPDVKSNCIRFEIIEASSEKKLGFDPTAFSSAGNATCPLCGTVADSEYVKIEGNAKRLSEQLMAIACTKPGTQGKIYLSPDLNPSLSHDESIIQMRLNTFCKEHNLSPPDEPMDTNDPTTVAGRGFGISNWSELFTSRQMLSLLAFAKGIKSARQCMEEYSFSPDHQKVLATLLAGMVDKLADFSSTFCHFNFTGGRGSTNTFGRQALGMTWDFSETNPFNPAGASWVAIAEDIPTALDNLNFPSSRQDVRRGSATSLPWHNETVDAVITDPPYYDNISYAVLSDFFYIWLKRSIGDLFPEHFGSQLTPKKEEAISDSTRHRGKEKGRAHYEQMMAVAFKEANRVMKYSGELVVVYAHKTTLGWSTLVNALRSSGFEVSEAWPLNTERPGGMKVGRAMLASSIFLVARKRDGAESGNYEEVVKPELGWIVRERVETLWAMGISGADLVIACIGAGLHAFTRFARVEYSNGEEVPAEQFLAEVETMVLETILNRLSKEVGEDSGRYSLAGVDPATRFYVLWRYTYKWTELDAGEAIVFANGTHVELDGQGSLSQGSRALIEKKKSKYELMDFKDRGKNDKLGLSENGSPAPLIDALHRTLWLMENQPTKLAEFLKESQVNREQMRLVAQALAGPALKGGELADVSPSSELAALGKLTANWRSVVEDAAFTPLERKAKRSGQRLFDYNNHETTE